MRSLASGFLAAVLVAGCALPPPRLSPTGRHTSVHTPTNRVSGELIAVTRDTVWLLTRPDGVLTPFRAENIVRLDVQRHRMGGTRTMQIMAVVGAATGFLLTISCSQVEDASCGAVLPGTMLPYLAFGALFAVVNFESAWMKFSRPEVTAARAYSRFPQGMPDTLRTTLKPTTP